ncbi:MAG: protein kinase, partial [Deltaproteobacteria bacterium]|nr:protein kinase [Deltaproteobacteria bacterium]
MTTDPLIGRTLGGSFLVERLLGQGGMGAVYVARHTRTGKGYAVKVLRPDHGARFEDAVKRFKLEAAALAKLNHPGIVAIQDVGLTEDGIDYLVMDLLEGEDLSERMARTGKIPLEEALRIFHETSVALTIAHEAGIIHRDLKPGNVFLRSTLGAPDRAMILDFGLVRMTESADAQHLTASGVTMGTPLYMAPEQAAGERVGEAADQYALAVMLYEMLSGEPPFTAPSAPALLVKVLTTTAPSLEEHEAAPAHVSAAVARAMSKAPGERFESVAAFLAAVEEDAEVGLALTRASDLPTIAATRALPATAPPGYADPPPGYAGASPVTNPTMRLERAVPVAAGSAVLLALLIVGGAFLWKATEGVTVSVSDVRTDAADGGLARPPHTRQITYTSTRQPWVGASPADAGGSPSAKPDSGVAAQLPSEADAGPDRR